MIGRGLRTIDPELYPGVVKKDCVVLDFGYSLLTHGSIDESVNLDGKDKETGGDAPTKVCPECDSVVPLSVKECPICGQAIEKKIDENSEMSRFVMTEIDVFDSSPFRWMDMMGNGKMLMASGFNGFGIIATVGDNSIAMVKQKNGKPKTVAIGTKVQAIASADDFLRNIETSNGANKSKRWLNELISDKQREHLARYGVIVKEFDFSWNKYKAACWLNYHWNNQSIDNLSLIHI